MNLPNAVFTVCLALGGIVIGRNFKKADETDCKVDALKEGHAVLDQKSDSMLERVVRCEHTLKTQGETVAANMQITRDSFHKAAEKNAETYARRDEMGELKRIMIEMPEKMENRFRGILADRDAHKP